MRATPMTSNDNQWCYIKQHLVTYCLYMIVRMMATSAASTKENIKPHNLNKMRGFLFKSDDYIKRYKCCRRWTLSVDNYQAESDSVAFLVASAPQPDPHWH